MPSPSIRSILTAAVLVLFLWFGIIRPAATQDQPGLEPYTPTRLEWAALELQANYGQNMMTADSPLRITYIAAEKDGRTVLCVLGYTGDFTAAELRLTKENITELFDIYSEGMGWPWLRLRFIEKSAGKSWPGGR